MSPADSPQEKTRIILSTVQCFLFLKTWHGRIVSCVISRASLVRPNPFLEFELARRLGTWEDTQLILARFFFLNLGTHDRLTSFIIQKFKKETFQKLLVGFACS